MNRPTGEGTRCRRLRSLLQDRPGFLVFMWRRAERILPRLKRPLDRFGEERVAAWVQPVEEIVKKPLFDCRMCGQCILHFTGMTCPMTCPKQLRNGPCGGVALDGTCEVVREMECVWVKAIERSAATPYAEDMGRLNPPVDWRLNDTAAWVTYVTERDQITTGIGTGPHHVSAVIGP